jgi:predicted ArsR family transcriptional regulator
MTAKVVQIRGKTEQRVRLIISCLKEAGSSWTYRELSERTDTPYDVLLYVLTALVEAGLVERETVADGPGRPRVHFTWASRKGKARAMGAR